MSLRLKLLLLFSLAVAAAAGVTAWNAERYAERQFQQADQQRSDALAAQFRRELSEREAEVTASVQTIADAESTVRMVLDLSSPQADPSLYAGDARGLAAARQLDFLELAGNDGTLISSAQWPDRVGSKIDWVTHENDWNQRNAFLDRVELPDRVELGLMAVRMVHADNLNLYIIGGQRFDSAFLGTLSLPAGMRALLYRNLEAGFVPTALSDAEGPVPGAESFAPLIESLQKQNGADQALPWSADSGNAEKFVSVPLTGQQGEFLGALLLGSAQGQRMALENYVGGSALLVAAAGMILAFFLSWWIAARVSGPLARLSEGIGEVTTGDWDAQVEAGSAREVQQAIIAFNKMTKQLADERADQVARERAAAWRQLAGQLAAELKALLPPLQKAVEGQAWGPPSADFQNGDEGGLDSAARFADGFAADRFVPGLDRSAPASSPMRQTLETLAACAGKLGEFASLPIPRPEGVNLNEAVRAAVQSFEPRFSVIGRPPITPELFLDEKAGPVRADPVLLRKALENLLLFVLEDMPAGGTFSISTRREDGMAHMILSHSGSGAGAQRGENRNTTLNRAVRVSGVGLSLATVQSILSSHGGKISIESAPLAGTTFYLDWPMQGAAASPAPVFPAARQTQAELEPQNPPKPELQSPLKTESRSSLQPELQSQPKNDPPLATPAQPPAPEKREEQKPGERQEVLKQKTEEAQQQHSPEPEAKLDRAAPLPAVAEAASGEISDAQAEAIAVAGTATWEFAAVIEEMIEIPAYAAKAAEFLAKGEKEGAAVEAAAQSRTPESRTPETRTPESEDERIEVPE